jgi:hypothetical protein
MTRIERMFIKTLLVGTAGMLGIAVLLYVCIS